jgi:BirA family transcriptional regulator, biotin operon repressor / biotin---[acetyl-CoA-carboxylase] ligase
VSEGNGQAFGAPHRHQRRCESTNDLARELAAAGAPAGTVVTAEEQLAGRGRQGRSWSAPPGKALLYSAVLRPLERRHMLLPLAVPVAVAEAAEATAGVECAIKWPNDIWIEERKCAGVLIEARPQDGWAVIGVGLNVAIEPGEFPAELRETATSLGGGATVEAALAGLNESLGRWAAAGEDEVLAGFRARDALRGREVSWEKGSGVADGIDERGNLIVELSDGERQALGAGEVHLARVSGS